MDAILNGAFALSKCIALSNTKDMKYEQFKSIGNYIKIWIKEANKRRSKK